MLTFDKLKIVTSINNININNETLFTQKVINETIITKKYSVKSPYNLEIELNYENYELVVEFSGKILGKDYPQLISQRTIRQCFDNINALGVCSLDVEAILNDAYVVKCDVTTDIDCDNATGLTSFINANVISHKKYLCQQLPNGNFIIEKNVTTKGCKKRLTIYDKNKEMNKTDNRRYMECYDIQGDEFDGKVRLEMNLNTQEQIRKALNLCDNNLSSVLNAQTNPIADFLDDILADTPAWRPTSKKEYEAMLVLQANDNDIEAVEATLRQICGSKFHPQRDLTPYREMLARGNTRPEFSKSTLIEQIRSVSN